MMTFMSRRVGHCLVNQSADRNGVNKYLQNTTDFLSGRTNFRVPRIFLSCFKPANVRLAFRAVRVQLYRSRREFNIFRQLL